MSAGLLGRTRGSSGYAMSNHELCTPKPSQKLCSRMVQRRKCYALLCTELMPVQADDTEITEYMVDGVVTARTIDHLVDSSSMCWSSRGRQRHTELHDEVNVSGNVHNCPVHEFVGVWEARPCPVHFAARGRELFSELHDWQAKVEIKNTGKYLDQALGVGLAVSGTAVSGDDAAAMLNGLSLFDVAGLQIAELHPSQVRGGSCVVDKGQMNAKATIGASFQDGQTKRVWRSWASCAASLIQVIGDELRKLDRWTV